MISYQKYKMRDEEFWVQKYKEENDLIMNVLSSSRPLRVPHWNSVEKGQQLEELDD